MNFFQKIKFILVKIKIYLRYEKNIKTTIKWILTGKEITNFTYKIRNENSSYRQFGFYWLSSL